jgi:hypothetical protein
MQFKKQEEWFSVEQCNSNPKKLYVFGDNTFRKGTGGQAKIRNCDNSFGICTKWAPNTNESAYFIDTINCLEIVERDIYELIKISKTNEYEEIIFPWDGLGSGLSKMPQKCPLLYRRMNKLLEKHFGISYNKL